MDDKITGEEYTLDWSRSMYVLYNIGLC